MDNAAFQPLESLGDSVDQISSLGARANLGLDKYATPLDGIVGKFDDVSRSGTTNADNLASRTSAGFTQFGSVVRNLSNDVQSKWNPELGSLNSSLAGSFFDLQHARKALEDTQKLKGKAGRAERKRAADRFSERFSDFKTRYQDWKSSQYQNWDEDRKKLAAGRRTAVNGLNSVRESLRKMVNDHPDDADLKGLVGSLTNVKKALLRGDLTEIELPGGGKFDPDKQTFKDYVRSWRGAVEHKQGELKKEAQKESSEAATKTPPTATRPAEASAAPTEAAARGEATDRTVRGETPATRPKTEQDRSLEAIDREWTRITEETAAGAPAPAAVSVAPKDETDERIEELATEANEAVLKGPDLDRENTQRIENTLATMRRVSTNLQTLSDETATKKTPQRAQSPTNTAIDEKLEKIATLRKGIDDYATKVDRSSTRVVTAPDGTKAVERVLSSDANAEAEDGLRQAVERAAPQTKVAPQAPEAVTLSQIQQESAEVARVAEEQIQKPLDATLRYSDRLPTFQKDVDTKIAALSDVDQRIMDLQRRIKQTSFPSGIVSGSPAAAAALGRLNDLQANIQRALTRLPELRIPPPEVPNIPAAIAADTEVIAHIQAPIARSASVLQAAATITTPSVGTALAPLAAVAGSALAAASALTAQQQRTATATLNGLAQQANTVLAQVRANATTGAGGHLVVPEARRSAIRDQIRNVRSHIRDAAASGPVDQRFQDLDTYLQTYQDGVVHFNGQLPEDAASLQRIETWEQDQSLPVVAPSAPIGTELETNAPAPPTAVTRGEQEQEFASVLDQTRARMTHAQQRPGPQAPPPPELGRMGPQQIRGIGPEGAPLGAAMGLLALQRRSTVARERGGNTEIPTLSRDTPLSDNSISFGAGGGGGAVEQPLLGSTSMEEPFQSYAAGGAAIPPPIAGAGVGETLTPEEETERARALRVQQMRTQRQFLGQAEGAPTAEALPPFEVTQAEVPYIEEIEEEEEMEGPDESAQARRYESQRQRDFQKKARERVQQELKKRVLKLTQQAAKTGAKATQAGARGALEMTELGTAPEDVGISLLVLILQLNLQFVYKYFVKGIGFAAKQSNIEDPLIASGVQKGMALAEMFEQSCPEDMLTVCVDMGICANSLFMPPQCCCTFVVIIVVAILGYAGSLLFHITKLF